jgi:hypothetical protein
MALQEYKTHAGRSQVVLALKQQPDMPHEGDAHPVAHLILKSGTEVSFQPPCRPFRDAVQHLGPFWANSAPCAERHRTEGPSSGVTCLVVLGMFGSRRKARHRSRLTEMLAVERIRSLACRPWQMVRSKATCSPPFQWFSRMSAGLRRWGGPSFPSCTSACNTASFSTPCPASTR